MPKIIVNTIVNRKSTEEITFDNISDPLTYDNLEKEGLNSELKKIGNIFQCTL